ncbi:MAG: hypothetical protein JWL69_4981 [Phycisphaerales bacterium]|nr:hypothetical protein [Phycisphaerales bacterium]
MSNAIEAFETTPDELEIPEDVDWVPAVGVIGTALGILGLVAFPFAVLSVASEYLRRGATVPDRGALNTFGLLASPAGCTLSLLVLLGGIGCMRLSAWARPVMLMYAVGSLAVGAVGIGFLIAAIERAQSPHGTPSFVYRIEAFPVWVGCVVGFLYGAWVLWVMTRPRVKRAFGGEHQI